MATAWPAVTTWLVTTTRSLWSPTLVLDGPTTSGDIPTAYALIGFSAGDTNADTPGQFTLTTSPDGLGVDESGHVNAQIVVASGDDDFSGPRVTAFGMFDALYAAVVADQTLGGVLAVNGNSAVAAVPGYVTNSLGVAFSLAVTLSYTTDRWPY